MISIALTIVVNVITIAVVTGFQNEIRKIDDILENEPDHPLYDFYAFSTENFGKIFRSFESPRIKSFIMRELRELFYDPLI